MDEKSKKMILMKLN